MHLEHHLARLISQPVEDISFETQTLTAGQQFTWTNQLGSTLVLSAAGNRIWGTYTSTVSGSGTTITGPVVGWLNGAAICWAVNWPTDPPSMTTWVGELGQSSNILTLWYLVEQTSNGGTPQQFWTAVNAGADQFTLSSAP